MGRIDTDYKQRIDMLKQEIDNELTEKIIGAFYDVYNALGYGFLEKAYENALKHELESRGLKLKARCL